MRAVTTAKAQVVCQELHQIPVVNVEEVVLSVYSVALADSHFLVLHHVVDATEQVKSFIAHVNAVLVRAMSAVKSGLQSISQEELMTVRLCPSVDRVVWEKMVVLLAI